MQLHDINPHIRYAGIHHTLLSPTEASRCYDCRLFYLMTGGATLWIGKNKYKLSNNTAVFLPPASTYILIREPGDFSIAVFNFDLNSENSHLCSLLETAAESEFDETKVVAGELPKEFSAMRIAVLPGIGDLLTRCTDEFLRGAEFFRERSSAYLKLCLFELLHVETGKNAESRLTDAVSEYIKKNYGNPDITNESIAAKFGYHPYYLSRVMRLATGKTLHRFLGDYRLHIAKNYLVTTDLDISVIARKTGFNSAAYFSKIFREQVSMTPKAYRRNNRGMI